MTGLPQQAVIGRERAGHLEIIGETQAKLLLFQQGWNPYSRFLDEDKVDLILRRNRDNNIEYREIQVKYRTLYAEDKQQKWENKLFSTTAWYPVSENAFACHRPGLFVMFIFGYSDRRIDSDTLIFPSCTLHQIIQESPDHKQGGGTKALYISRSISDSKWYVRRTRRTFTEINATNCLDVTHYRNHYGILD